MKSACGWVAVLTFVLLAGTAVAGDMKVAPYGFVLVNGGYNSHLATDIPVRAPLLTNLRDSSGTFLLTARQTRFGLKLMMDSVQGWSVKGQIELDFWGQKGSFGNGASMQSAPRLRLAFFTLKKENLQLVFGQDWTCFAPLSPNSLAHVSIPAFSSSGNLWNRLPQIRLDYTAPMESGNSVLIQIAAVRPIAADVTDDSQAEVLGAGEFGVLPFAEARAAFNYAKTFTIGASAHFGQEDWHKAYPAVGYTDDKTTSFGVAGDAKVTSGIVTFSAEGFTGSNLNMLFSNAGNYTETVDSEKKREGVDVVGGWGEIALKPKDSKVSFNAGVGMEILKEETVEKLAMPAVWKNMTAFGAVMYDPLPKVTFALELGYIKTTYKVVDGSEFGEDDANNLNVNAGFRLSF